MQIKGNMDMKQLRLAPKQFWLSLILFALAFTSGCRTSSDMRATNNEPAIARPRTFSSFDKSSGTNAPIAAHSMRFVEADIKQVFNLYETLSRRTLILSPQVPLTAKVTFENSDPLTVVETLQLLDDVLAAQQIVMVYEGTQYVKAVPMSLATKEPAPIVDRPWKQLPESSTYITYITKLKKLAPSDAVSILTPFARLPNSIVAYKNSNMIVIRDFSGNVRRMMEVLERVESNQIPLK